MQLLLIVYGGPAPKQVQALLESEQVEGYTELAPGHGAGLTGRLEGTRAWPGATTVLLSAVPDERAPRLVEALRAFKTRLSPGEHLHVASLPITTYL